MISEVGIDPGTIAALEASKRIEHTRRAALNRALAEKRRCFAAQVALSLAEILSDDATGPMDGSSRA
jgi:hypothetical protein